MRLLVFLLSFSCFAIGGEIAAVNKLTKHFDLMVKDIDSYRQRVENTCSSFPEGEIFPYTFPAIAYVLLANEGAQKKSEDMIALAIQNTDEHVGIELLKLKSYREEATFLGQLNLALSIYLLRYENDEFKRLNDHLSELLLKAFEEENYAQIKSYPYEVWSFDSIPALLSIKLNKSIDQQRKGRAIKKHLEWLRAVASEKKTTLPYSIFKKGKLVAPRGCDLSFRLPLIYFLDEGYAKDSYEAYKKFFWKSGVLSGFKEYEDETIPEDIDSGPIIFGVGATATALAYPCFELFDEPAKKQLYEFYLSQIPMIQGLIRQTNSSYVQMLDENSFTGLHFGDCTLFYALTIHRLDDLLKSK